MEWDIHGKHGKVMEIVTQTEFFLETVRKLTEFLGNKLSLSDV